MPFLIVRNDITNIHADAIVNTANPRAIVGRGADSHIHAKAGPELLAARKKIGDIPVGSAAVTDAYALDAKYVIHAVGPAWQGGVNGEAELLRSCYDNALNLAWKLGCRSVAFPLISAGFYGYPNAAALEIAISAFSAFLMKHNMRIILTVFNTEAFRLAEQLFDRVESYIDENFILELTEEEYSYPRNYIQSCPYSEDTVELHSIPDFNDLEDGFSETLLKFIDRSGKKDSEVYKKANIDRKLFSKIKNNPNYQPSKVTVFSFAVGLELDLEDTKKLLASAGFALSRSSRFDLILEFFIKEGNYDMFRINQVLYDFDQTLLGV